MSTAKLITEEQVEQAEVDTLPVNFERRTLKTSEDGVEFERDFIVHTIKSSEDFKPATEHKSTYAMRMLGGNKVMRIQVRGISFGEWEGIDSQYVVPEVVADAEEKEKQRQQDERDKIISWRQVKVFELSTGKTIPGETEEQKADWLSENVGAGELTSLFDIILEKSSNVLDTGSLVFDYNNAIKKSDPIISDFNDMSDWVSLSAEGNTFRMQRPFEDHIVEIPIRQVTDKKKKQIDEESKGPMPPSKPKMDKSTGRQVGVIYDYKNPGYKQQAKLANRKSIVLLFESCLHFSLPGNTTEEKFKWVSSLLLGDVVKLRRFIENEVFNYKGRIDFFS